MPSSRHLLASWAVSSLAYFSFPADTVAQVPTATEWQNSGSGFWTTPENWTSYEDEGTTYYLTPAADVPTTIGQGTSTIDSGAQESGDLTVEGSGGATLSITGGSLQTFGSADVGGTEDTTGTVTISGANWTVDDGLNIGGAGNGSVSLSLGATGSATWTDIGMVGTGSLTVDDSIWTTADLCIGGDGTGTVSVLNGGEIKFFEGLGGSICVGNGYEGTAVSSLTVSGAGSKILDSEFGTDITIGAGTEGLMTINQGGRVETFTSDIGYGANGTVEVADASSLWRSGYTIIGTGNEGTLTISAGATVESLTVQAGLSAYYYDGENWTREAGHAFVTVTGEDSLWQIDSENYGEGTLDFYSGELKVEDGGTVRARNMQLVTEDGDTSTMTISGENSQVHIESMVTEDYGVDGGELIVGGEGTASVSVLNGGLLVTENAQIGTRWMSSSGDPITGSAQVTVSGAGSVWDGDASHRTDDYTDRGYIDIGVGGDGTLLIEEGGVVRSAYGSLGTSEASSAGHGVATVTGSGSLWELVSTEYDLGFPVVLGGELLVGGSGLGELSVLDGGTVTARVVSVGSSDTSDMGLGGSILVDGESSKLEVTTWEYGTEHYYDNYEGGELIIGDDGPGSLTVSNGGSVKSFVAAIGSGYFDSTGTVTVTGEGSEWIIGQQWGENVDMDGFLLALQVGGGDSGVLSIEDGGLVQTWGATINETGQVKVSGSGSQLLVEGKIYTDPEFGQFQLSGLLSSAGEVLIENGGQATAHSVFLWDGADLTVTGTDSELSIIGIIGNGMEGDRYLLGGELDTSGQTTISDGGTIKANAVWSYGSGIPDAPSLITVTGSGSHLLVEEVTDGPDSFGGEIEIGVGGEASLTVEDAGYVSSVYGVLGLSQTYLDPDDEPITYYGTGHALITGDDSEWESTLSLTVGQAGEGYLTVAELGRITVQSGLGDILVADEATAIGVITIGDGDGNGGEINAASITAGDGDATLVFDHTETAYTLQNSAGDGVTLNGNLKVLANEGTTILKVDSTYTGGTTIEDGAALQAQSNQALGQGNVEVRGGGTLIVTENVALDLGEGHSIALTSSDAVYSKHFAANEALANYGEVTDGAGTTTRLLAGTSGGGLIETSFGEVPASGNDEIRQSSVFSLDNLGSIPFVLELEIGTSTDGMMLGWFDEDLSLWVNAIDGNTGNLAAPYQQNYSGSFDAFQLQYGISLVSYMGAWGHDGTRVWAVLNHNSDFAVVTAVPEPGTAGLLALGGLLLMAARRKRKA